MERRIGDEIHLGKTINLLDSIEASKSIDRTASDFDNANEKIQKVK